MWDVGGPGVISLGGYVGYKGYSYKYNVMGTDAKSSWNYTIIGVRSAYHFSSIENEKLDLYAGIMLGYYFVNFKHTSSQGSIGSSGSYGNSLAFDLYPQILTDPIRASAVYFPLRTKPFLWHWVLLPISSGHYCSSKWRF